MFLRPICSVPNHVEIGEKYYLISQMQEVAVCRYIRLVLHEGGLKRKQEELFLFFVVVW